MLTGNRLISAHAGSEDGFITGVQLICKSGTASDDYYSQMNGNSFNKWVEEMLLSNLPEKSVVIFYNEPYHSTQVDKPPRKYAMKSQMISWL